MTPDDADRPTITALVGAILILCLVFCWGVAVIARGCDGEARDAASS